MRPQTATTAAAVVQLLLLLGMVWEGQGRPVVRVPGTAVAAAATAGGRVLIVVHPAAAGQQQEEGSRGQTRLQQEGVHLVV
jgi:hypothetical protein